MMEISFLLASDLFDDDGTHPVGCQNTVVKTDLIPTSNQQVICQCHSNWNLSDKFSDMPFFSFEQMTQ